MVAEFPSMFYHWPLVRNRFQLFTARLGFMSCKPPRRQSAWQQLACSRTVGASLFPVLRVSYNESQTWEWRLPCEVTSPSPHTFCSAEDTPGCTPAHRRSLQKGRTHRPSLGYICHRPGSSVQPSSLLQAKHVQGRQRWPLSLFPMLTAADVCLGWRRRPGGAAWLCCVVGWAP